MILIATVCLFGAYQKLRDKAAPQRLPGLRQRIVTPSNDPVGYRLSIGLNLFFAVVFLGAAYLTAVP